MRIIAGRFKSRKLRSPAPDMPARPMTDRIRETLFNQLRGHIEGRCILDLFAGSGSLGLEAISRGAASCVFVEQDRRMARLIEQNIDDLGIHDQAEVFIGDALGQSVVARLPRRPPHLVFLDPPYALMDDSFGCRRVLEQMARIGAHMDAQGFLLLRTAWPIGRTIVQPASDPEDADGAGSAGAQAEGRDEPTPPLHELLPRHRYERTQHWLENPPALIGPETHIYGSMAIHWYQPVKVG